MLRDIEPFEIISLCPTATTGILQGLTRSPNSLLIVADHACICRTKIDPQEVAFSCLEPRTKSAGGFCSNQAEATGSDSRVGPF